MVWRPYNLLASANLQSENEVGTDEFNTRTFCPAPHMLRQSLFFYDLAEFSRLRRKMIGNYEEFTILYMFKVNMIPIILHGRNFGLLK